MKLTEFYKKYGFNNALSMLNAMLSEPVTGYTQNSPIARENFKKLLNERNYEFELPEESTLELMRRVNKMVKSAECPSNRRNKFYMMKHRFIKTMLSDGRVDKILESENLYHFFIGEYDFHQMKEMYKNITPDGTEVYIKEDTSLPFAEEVYRKCIIRMVYDISVSRYNKYRAKLDKQ